MTEQNGVERSSATEVLRRMLDEHGIECTYGYGIVSYKSDSHWCNAWEYGDGMMCVSMGYFTPEQVIATTLGQEDTYTREDVESAFVSGYSLGSLPIGSDPRWDENRQTVDEHMAELGWVRKEVATLGRGTCRAIVSDNLTESEGTGDAWADCSECGHLLFVLTDPSSKPPRYCPNCGRKVVDE